MATLNDVLKEVLEKDFNEEDVEKVVNPPEYDENDRENKDEHFDNEDAGDTYAGPGEFTQNSIGRSAVESFIKNSIYEKYGIDDKAMREYAKMTPTEMISDFGKSVGELGRIRSDYQNGKLSASEYKSAMSHCKGEVVGKMLEMGSSRKSILEDVFLRSVGVGPEDRSIHSFRDLVDAFRGDETDPVDKEASPDSEQPDIEPQDMELNPDTDIAPDVENPDAELLDTDKPDQEELERTSDQDKENDKIEEQPETEEQPEIDSDREEVSSEDNEPEIVDNDVEADVDSDSDSELETNLEDGNDIADNGQEETHESEDDDEEPEDNEAMESGDTDTDESEGPDIDSLNDDPIPEADTDDEVQPEEEDTDSEELKDEEPDYEVDTDESEGGDRDMADGEGDDYVGEDKKQDEKSDAIENEDDTDEGEDKREKSENPQDDEEPEVDGDGDITDIDELEVDNIEADELDYDTVSADADDPDILETDAETSDTGENPDMGNEMDSEIVERDNAEGDGFDEFPDGFDPDAEADIDIEADVETVPDEVLDMENVPDAQEFENMLNDDVQDMADYAAGYEGAREDIGDIEDYGDMDIDLDVDPSDVDVTEEPFEPEANFEADIDMSEIADIVEGAEEGAEIIAALL